MSILSGKKILEEMKAGNISITPFNEKYVNPISIDLTLGTQIAVYKNAVKGNTTQPWNLRPSDYVLDAKVQEPTISFDMSDDGFVLCPGIGYLMHTHERVATEKYVPIIDGKSSVGRLFIQIHSTAGLGDPGFDGQFTLEVMVTQKVKVYPGMRIGQVRFYGIDGEHESYAKTGHYNGQNAMGPIASQLWKSFING